MFTPFVARALARSSRGLSLVEVLVAAMLGSVVLYVIVTTLVPVLRASALGTARVDLDQRGTLAATRLIKALRATTRSGVMTGSLNGVQALSTHPLQGAAADSGQQWASYLRVFSWKGQTLTESEVPLSSPPTTATALSLPALLAALDTSPPRFSVNNVTQFSVTLDAEPRVHFHLLLEKGKDKLDIERTVFFVNSSQS